ncbi:MAG: undecaprenyldiphospho-muramoylpentapeptide beta-N-acetylglucosaminyltransferase [Bacteroidetes bacterium GWF2_41_61]|jgi:UDP-N-acetylglucosamine--N-acetylmuramyl-(pentapeptide) pyrophosphoryl-undecaprenol N-acetylglucosamine transferase|nr:MAG: undecaprenyldiphospho-muramoylpentapeptide beta-N-acetylglucosaminyltransferase [Bacteroidetes bacterium GWE2_40_15]OFY27597.1 MAG: undecaprenyldiphospho-muramoylpentapeptide beta-N-acetylglucosaminyltransferase [Bacteroidetes bacterium GWF2_41_61]OFY91079.1 MAG: undecaprenyldiphospho-muramoylpentapeptide beta-N-acetylglucosaminyltransferase [Bacteroidetes bacterium RIFOXYA12_FULL_40_10]PKP05907.1 MAG: undecaprenyldiphospho-muramoylpentapeptide beta-N-acetylglucosaminyltransferase [Bacte
MKKTLRVIVSGGGTGGHIFPAISIANALKVMVPDCEILFVGALGRMEMERVPSAGYEIVGLPVAGLKRSLSADNLKLPFKLIKSFGMASGIIKRFRPDVAVGVGGYASAPVLFMASVKGVPYVIQEQNSFAGVTNRILGRGAKTICVAYPSMERFFPADKIKLTGNPVRKGIERASAQMRERALNFFNLDGGKRTILILGGSLGAGTLNSCVKNWIEKQVSGEINLIWQCGKVYYKEIEIFNKNNPRDFVRCFEFIKEMDLAFAAADLVISRAGAGTISELCIAAKATIFVPSPNVAEDHQRHNAMALVEKGAAIMIPDSEAVQRLMDEAVRVVNNPEELAQMEDKIEEMAIRDSAEKIANEVLRVCGYNKNNLE